MSVEERLDDYTQDGTVDLKGKPVVRSNRGGWRACSFVISGLLIELVGSESSHTVIKVYTIYTPKSSQPSVYEVFERMAYYGISANLILYLTKKLHQGTVTSANNVTNWVGTVWMTPIFGAYIADAHLGRYWTFVIASAIYLLGMSVLTLAVSVPGLRPPHCSDPDPAHCKKASTLQLAVFYGALYTLAIGTGGTKPNISTIGAGHIFFGTLFANTILVYIQDTVGWALGYGLPTAGLLVSISIFLAGTPFYRHRVPAGSPFTRMAMVIVAALRNWRVPIPSDPKEFYELDLEEYTKKGKFRIDSTPSLRFLNKACVKTGSTSSWTLCSVTQVEETKQMLRMIPILIATFVPSTMLAQTNTLFVKQGTTLHRKFGSFSIPPASLAGFITLSMLVSVVIYDRYFVKLMRKWTKNPRGITLLQRMGIGLVFHVFIMLIASLTERHRLSVAKKHNVVENGGQVPLSIFVLLPQFVLMGSADAFLEVAKIEFFYDQAPEGMKSLGTSYAMTSLGIGNFISTFLLSIVSRITKQNGHQGWILNNLNASHLDYYYGFFSILNLLNFVFFLGMCKMYVYKAEVSDSMEILTQELGGSNYTVPTLEEPNENELVR
ncbi:Protein NRT1/ PTR FAMILY 5.2 [Camellia lanceoleosa]|uniref:Protein NRT1/ PTR FAMILY 5.2 n=1 Tax=Camellia lanceoleosa TaxID=1840588 RepID=A0ACC0GMD7_9ERIC|nr:Protein NRT1/ PTR FAMILY 5.2 [Camellia lanceoleosa]